MCRIESCALGTEVPVEIVLDNSDGASEITELVGETDSMGVGSRDILMEGIFDEDSDGVNVESCSSS